MWRLGQRIHNSWVYLGGSSLQVENGHLGETISVSGVLHVSSVQTNQCASTIKCGVTSSEHLLCTKRTKFQRPGWVSLSMPPSATAFHPIMLLHRCPFFRESKHRHLWNVLCSRRLIGTEMERWWLGSQKPLLLLRRTWAWFSAFTWGSSQSPVTPVSGYLTSFMAYVVYIQTSKKHTYTNASFLPFWLIKFIMLFSD